MDLFGIYQGLKHVHLQTLTKVGFLELEILISPLLYLSNKGYSFSESKDREVLQRRKLV